MFRISFIFTMSIPFCYSVILMDNAYQNITVVISPAVSEDHQLVDSIKELFRKGSPVLFEATRRRAYFGHVTIAVPSSWTPLPDAKASHQKLNHLEDADIRVDHPHPYYGDRPYTLQAGSCGQSGKYIHLTPSFLHTMWENKFGPPGNVLVHEWSHYRYGVFDEFGDIHDRRYPLFYQSNDRKIHPSICPSNIKGWMLASDASLNSDRNCSLDENGQVSSDCRFYPDPADRNVKGSLMSIPTQVGAYCDDSASQADGVIHNVQAPHPHNVKCGGKSVWKVVSSHPDFVGNPPRDGVVDAAPTFSVVRTVERSTASFLLLIDSSESMAKRLPHLKTALNRMMDLLPDERIRVGVMSFNSNSSMLIDILPLNPLHLENIKLIIQNLAVSTGTHLAQALYQTIQMSSPGDDLAVILFTDGKINKGYSSIDPLIPQMHEHGISLNSILFYGNNTAPEIFNSMEHLARQTGGKLYLAKLKSNSGPPADVEMAFLDILKNNVHGDGRIVQLHANSGISTKKGAAEGSFIVDPDIGHKLLFIFGCCHNSTEFRLEVNLTSPSGRQYASLEQASDVIRNNNSRTLLFKVDGVMMEIGRWTYRLLTGNLTGDVSVSVIGQSIGSKVHGQSISIDSWISRSNLSVPSVVTVLSRLSRGYSPVLNATVLATIDRPTGTAIDVRMTDDGQGADSFAHDGIYSGYFVHFDAAGRYSVTVRVSGTNDTIYLEKLDDDSNHPPGGSTALESAEMISNIPLHEAKSSFEPESFAAQKMEDSNEVESWAKSFLSHHIDLFERIDMAGSLRLDQFHQNEDTIPPEQVQDLQLIRVQHIPLHNKVIIHLQWTSAGDDYLYGTAKEIEIRYSSSPEFFRVFRLGTLVTDNNVTHGQLRPQSAGTIHKLGIQIDVPMVNGTHLGLVYFALTTIDDANNRADPSNYLYVYIPARPEGRGLKIQTVTLLLIILAIVLTAVFVCVIHFCSRHIKHRRQLLEMAPRNRLANHQPRCLDATRRSSQGKRPMEFSGFVNYARECSPPPAHSAVVLQTFG